MLGFCASWFANSWNNKWGVCLCSGGAVCAVSGWSNLVLRTKERACLFCMHRKVWTSSLSFRRVSRGERFRRESMVFCWCCGRCIDDCSQSSFTWSNESVLACVCECSPVRIRTVLQVWLETDKWYCRLAACVSEFPARLRVPIFFVTFETTLSTCASHNSVLSMMTPRYLYSLTMDRVASQHRIKMSAGHCWCLGGRSIAFVLFTLMQRPLSAGQVPRRVAASDRQAARVVGVFPLQYINMSSAKSTDLMVFVAERTSGTFLVYSKNRSGPKDTAVRNSTTAWGGCADCIPTSYLLLSVTS